MSKVLSVCPFCGCGCGALLESSQNELISTFPQRSHPVSRGTLCAKGWNGHQIVHHPGRLTRPFLKEQGERVPVSWERAIDQVAERLKAITSSAGPEAVGVVASSKCTNEEIYLTAKFTRAVLGSNNIDSSMRFYQAPTVAALQPHLGAAASTASILDLEGADAILMFGINAKDQSARIGSLVLGAAKRGARCLLVDPRELEHSQFFSHQVKPRPGTDLWLVQAMIHEILEHDLGDPSVKTEALKKSVQRYAPESVEQITAVAAADITRLADAFATAKKGVILYGTGLTQSANATAQIEALVDLARLTGNLPGLLPVMPTNNMQGIIDMGACPELLPGHQSVDDEEARRRIENLWGRPLPTAPGLTLQEMVQQAGKKIKAMWIIGENLVWSAPQPAETVKALNELDFLVVQDLFMTETAQLADVVLPAASYAEKSGTFTSTERRVQKVRRAIPPLGEARTDDDIIAAVSSRMGVTLSAGAEKLGAEIAQTAPMYGQIAAESLEGAGGAQWSVKNGVPGWIEISEPAEAAEKADDEYPFTLVVNRIPVHRMTGTLTTRSFILDKEFPVGIVEINSEDARELKVRPGWRIKLITRRGEIIRKVVVNKSVPRKTVFVPIHHKEGLTQDLVNTVLESRAKIPQMKVCAAKLETV